jgi:hypothetical protein
MMLLALCTSCLKDSHTNFQINVGIGITYFEDFPRLYSKIDAARTMNYSCLKDSHTNFQSYIGIGITYFGIITPLYAENDAASNTN